MSPSDLRVGPLSSHDTLLQYYACGLITLDPVILEAGRKFNFELEKDETPKLFAVSVEYSMFPVISKFVEVVSCYFQIEGSKVICPQLPV